MNNYDKIKNLLDFKKNSSKQSSYAGKKFTAGYHSLTIGDELLEGQRDPHNRIDSLNIDFNNKIVLDIGCNAGGILFDIQDKIKYGIGVDYDYKIINFANKVAKTENYNNLDFYTVDLDNDDLSVINYYSNQDQKFDIIFLLAVCMWINKWPELIDWVKEHCSICVFETNGNAKQQQKQVSKLMKVFKSVELINDNSADDDDYLINEVSNTKRKNHPLRMLYLCKS